MSARTNTVNSGKANSSAKKGLHFNQSDLEELHWSQGLSMTDIGRRYGVTAQAIKYWMNKWGVAHRSQLQDVLFEPSPTLSYVYGVLHGDGFLYQNPASGGCLVILSVVDKPFADSFRSALMTLGLRAPMIQTPSRGDSQAQWRVYATSKRFHELWHGQSTSERIAWGMHYPADFIRGIYESEGSVKYHRGSLELAIYSMNGELQDVVQEAIEYQGWTVKRFQRLLESDKTFHYVQLFRALEVRRFLAWIRPCIKYQPRNANPEPSQDGDILEGVETTNVN